MKNEAEIERKNYELLKDNMNRRIAELEKMNYHSQFEITRLQQEQVWIL
jgi:hypothetical protein